MATTNPDALGALYDALASSDYGAVLGLLPDHIRAHVPGTSQVAGGIWRFCPILRISHSIGERSHQSELGLNLALPIW